MNPDKQARIRAIAESMERFWRPWADNEYEAYAKGLLARIVYLPRMNLQRGRPEIWAAAIVTVIARLNFLFDRENPDATTMDAICEFFGTVKSTTRNKATDIEEACDIRMGEPGLCREEITDALASHATDDGFMMPTHLLTGSDGGKRLGKRPAASRSRSQGTDGMASQSANASTGHQKTPATRKKRKNDGNDRQMHLFDDF